MTDLSADVAALPDRSLLVLDDDAPLRTRLGRALEQRGFEPTLLKACRLTTTNRRSRIQNCCIMIGAPIGCPLPCA